MLNKARSQVAEVVWICAAAENTGVTAGQFDFVFNVGAIHHFQDRSRVFGEMDRLLRGTGTLGIATDSETTLLTLMENRGTVASESVGRRRDQALISFSSTH